MPRITILLLILFLFACGKINKNTETAQDSTSVIITEAEPQPLTEAECWKLFDTFWIEFQRAIVNDDTNKIKTMCEFEDKEHTDWFLKTLTFSEFKEVIKEINKNNNYEYWSRSYGGNIEFQRDIKLQIDRFRFFISLLEVYILDFEIKDNYYKLTFFAKQRDLLK